MKLHALIRGDNLADLDAKANAICDLFYGGAPYIRTNEVWDAATAEYNQDETFKGFFFDMRAQPA